MTRLLLSLLVVAFFVLCLAGMWLGWRNRRRRQAYLPAPPVCPDVDTLGEPLLPPTNGVYVGTTTAGDWQDRIVVHGLGARSTVEVTLYEQGLLLAGATTLWLPADALMAARADRALAGKAMGTDGLLVFRWRLGGHELDSGVRGDDPDAYRDWIACVHGVTAADAQRGE
jgi:hypothetical protein